MSNETPIPPNLDSNESETNRDENPNDAVEGNDPSATNTGDLSVNVDDTDVVVNSMGNAYQGQPNLDKDDPESAAYDGPETTIDQKYTYATYTDPARQRDPNGVYLDDLERNKAEVIRAKIEGREPQLGLDAPAYGGDVIVPIEQAAKQLPGDYTIPVVSTLPVSVGNPTDDDEDDE